MITLSQINKIRFAWLLVLIAPACFSSNMLLARAMAGIFPPVSMALTRWLLVAIILSTILSTQIYKYRHILLDEWRQISFLGGLGMGLCGAPIYIAGTLTTATNIGLIYSVCPLLILLINILAFKSPMRLLPVSGMLAGLAGVVFILTKGDMAILASLSFNSGDMLVLVGTMAFAVYSLGLKYIPTKLPALVRFAAMALAGALWHLPFYIWEAGVNHEIVTVTYQIIVVVLILVFISSLAAYLSYGYIVQHLGAAQAATILYISPLYNALLAVLLLGEMISAYHLIGIALILPGLWLAHR